MHRCVHRDVYRHVYEHVQADLSYTAAKCAGVRPVRHGADMIVRAPTEYRSIGIADGMSGEHVHKCQFSF